MSTGIEDRLKVRTVRKGDLAPLPDFARWLIELGRRAQLAHALGEPRVVTLVVPNRKYASSLIALGALEAALASVTAPTDDPEVGTLIKAILPGGTLLVGSFLGRKHVSSKYSNGEYVGLALKGTRHAWVPASGVCIEPVDRSTASPTGFAGSTLPIWFPIVEEAYGGGTFVAKLAGVKKEVAVYGVLRRLEEEMGDDLLYVTDYPDAVQFSTLLFTKPGAVFNKCVEVRASTSEPEAQEAASVVILDGDKASQVQTAGQSTVVILEPTTSTFVSAVTFLQSRLQFHTPDHDWPAGSSYPVPSIEWTCHRA